jgi:ABC-type uncharacterized transport system auxiliary subunit
MGTPGTPEPVYYYALEYAPPKILADRPLPCAVRFEAFVASPPFDTRRIVYTDAGPHRNTYARHQWIAPPGEMLPYLFARDLKQAGGFHGVFPPDSAVRATHSVHGWIEAFLEQDASSRWTASAIVHVTLLSNTIADPTRRIVFQKRYAEIEPCSARSPGALAEAMARAVSRISEAAGTDIYNRLRSMP